MKKVSISIVWEEYEADFAVKKVTRKRSGKKNK